MRISDWSSDVCSSDLTVTRIPDTPDFIKGVVNLRGTIVPVIDLRQKLKFERADYDAFTVMIILNIAKRVVGMVVDSVSDVMQLSAEQIRPAPEFGASVDTRFITGLGAIDDRMLILVDIEKRSEERRVGKAWVSKCRSRWSPL